jgi:hypothetical protein
MGVNLFKIGRDLIGGAKGFGKSFVPPKRVPKPTKYPIAPKAQAEMKKAYDTAQGGRQEAFSRQIMAGTGTVLATGYAMTRDKPKSATAPTAAPAARKATPEVKKPHPRLADYAIPAAPKKPGILSRVATSLKSKVSSKPASKPAGKSISKPASKSASKPSTRKSNFRKSDNRLGGFGGAQRASARRESAKKTKSTLRAEIDYTAPMWSGNTPTNMASYGKATKAPAPKVRAEVKASKPKVVTPKPTSLSSGKADTRGGSNILGSVKNFYAKTYNLPQTPSKPKTQTVTKRESRTGGKPDTRGAYGTDVTGPLQDFYRKTYDLPKRTPKEPKKQTVTKRVSRTGGASNASNKPFGPLNAAKAWYKKTYNL